MASSATDSATTLLDLCFTIPSSVATHSGHYVRKPDAEQEQSRGTTMATQQRQPLVEQLLQLGDGAPLAEHVPMRATRFGRRWNARRRRDDAVHPVARTLPRIGQLASLSGEHD